MNEHPSQGGLDKATRTCHSVSGQLSLFNGFTVGETHIRRLFHGIKQVTPGITVDQEWITEVLAGCYWPRLILLSLSIVFNFIPSIPFTENNAPHFRICRLSGLIPITSLVNPFRKQRDSHLSPTLLLQLNQPGDGVTCEFLPCVREGGGVV